jgi:hypothetical protein
MARTKKGAVPRKRIFVHFAAEVLELSGVKCEIRECTRPAAWNLYICSDRNSEEYDDEGKSVCEAHLKSAINRLILDAG